MARRRSCRISEHRDPQGGFTVLVADLHYMRISRLELSKLRALKSCRRSVASALS